MDETNGFLLQNVKTSCIINRYGLWKIHHRESNIRQILTSEQKIWNIHFTSRIPKEKGNRNLVRHDTPGFLLNITQMWNTFVFFWNSDSGIQYVLIWKKYNISTLLNIVFLTNELKRFRGGYFYLIFCCQRHAILSGGFGKTEITSKKHN